MRKFLTVLFVLLLSTSLMSQVRTGNIYGKVIDEDGNALPGVIVTLTGTMTAPLTSISSAEGNFRFISLAAASDYVIKAELEGFNTEIMENIIINVGANVELTVPMQMGSLEEEVTVTAVTPVVDTKKTTVAQNVTRDVLQSLPTARDPWVVLQQAPGVMVDRENVGGSESGQQSGYMAKGGGADQWSMDGVTITDVNSISSPGYYDFDAFEEINITLGGADVTVQTGGIQMNLVSRRGGNRASLGGRFFFTDGDKFQADNLTQDLMDEGVTGTNRIKIIKDFGFNMGGPLVQDKAWWWMSYGVQDITNSNLYGTFEATMLNNYAAKLNVQIIPDNRFEAFIHVGGKEKTARSASYSFPGGWHQTGAFHFGSPLVKVQDEHMFGENLFISVKFAYSNSGFNLIPEDDLNQEIMVWRNVDAGIWENSYGTYQSLRPLNQYNFQGNYFNDNLFGAGHEVKFGFEYADRSSGGRWGWSGNARIRYNYNTAQIDLDGDNVRDINRNVMLFEQYRANELVPNAAVKAMTAFLSDTITFGRFNLTLGVRWDQQTPSRLAYNMSSILESNKAITDNVSAAAAAAMNALMPALEVPAVDPDFKWSYIQPRLGLTYDITGDGKTIAKLSYGQFRDYMGTGYSGYFSPGGTGGWVDYWWMDNFAAYGGNGDGIVDLNELYWTYPGQYAPQRTFDDAGNFIGDQVEGEGYRYSGYDIDNPQAIGAPRYTMQDTPAMRTNEIIASVERELFPDFGVALDFTYRRFDKFDWGWRLEWEPDTGVVEEQSDYVLVGHAPTSIPGYDLGEGAGKPYYLQGANIPYRYYRLNIERPDYYRDFMGLEMRFNKRMSNKWMVNGSFTYQLNKVHYGAEGLLNPTNKWAIDNNYYAPEMGGGSGKEATPHNSIWLAKLAGLYQLPLDFNVSFTFNARQGNPVFHTLTIDDGNAPNGRDTEIDMYMDKIDKIRLPNFWNLNLRLEKIIRVGDTGRIYVMADLFNALNQNMMLRRYENHHGTYYPVTGNFSRDATDNKANEILNPRVLRFGVRFQF